MATLSQDTPTAIEGLQIDRLRQMPVWRKMELLAGMNQAVGELALAGLRVRHPEDTSVMRRRRLADLLLGSELATRAYGPMLEDT
jgi:hypothetical protein